MLPARHARSLDVFPEGTGVVDDEAPPHRTQVGVDAKEYNTRIAGGGKVRVQELQAWCDDLNSQVKA